MPSRYRFAMASALPLLGLSLLQPTPVAAQSAGPNCEVSGLVLEVTTGGDDLRGGQNNLNVEIHLLNGEVRTFTNVNHSANWGNNSRHQVELNLVRPTASTEISYVRLIHLAQGSLEISPSTVASPVGVAAGLKTQDNWDMARLEVIVTDGGREERVGEAGPYRFTGDNTQLSVHLRFPPNACSSAQVPIQGRRPGAGAMTNQDVIRMTKAGVPESAIIAAIKRAPPGGFDFAPAAQQELNQAGVSPALLRAMHEHGTPNADDLNPQPYPPKGRGYEQPTNPGVTGALNPQPLPPGSRGGPRASLATRNFVMPPHVRVFGGPEVKNPAALSPAMTESIRSLGPGPIGAGETMSAQLPGRPQRSAARASARFNRESSSATSFCHGPPVIASVEANHSTAAVQFTPDGRTEYIITGCGFGSAPGHVALTGDFSAHGGKIALLPYQPGGSPAAGSWGTHWSDRHIEAMVDPSVRGEMDLGSVALVVTPASGAPVYGAHYSFRARRGNPIKLGSLPTSSFCDYYAIGDKGKCTFPGFVSFGGGFSSPCGNWDLHDCTVEILRSGFHVGPGFKMPEDYYTLNLKRGFVIYAAGIEVVGLDDKIAYVAPTPVIRGNIVSVQPPIFGNPADVTSFTLSLYGLSIYVVGPDGIADPWADQ